MDRLAGSEVKRQKSHQGHAEDLFRKKADELNKMSDYFEAKYGGKPNRIFVSSKEMRLYQMFGYIRKLEFKLVDVEEVNRPSITINDLVSRDAKNKKLEDK